MRQMNPKTFAPALIATGLLLVPMLMQAGVAEARDFSDLDVRTVPVESGDPLGALLLEQQAEGLREAGDCARALPLYVQLHQRDAARATPGYRHCLIAQGQLIRASALVETPDSADAVLLDVLQRQTDTPEADLRAALTRSPNDARLWNALGRVLDTEGRHASARNAYAMAGQAGQAAGLTENNLGQSFLMEGRLKSAREAFTRAVAQDPDRALFDNNRRRVSALQGDYATAIAGLDAARGAILLRECAELAQARGERKLARMMITQSQKIAPRHDPVTALLAARLAQ